MKESIDGIKIDLFYYNTYMEEIRDLERQIVKEKDKKRMEELRKEILKIKIKKGIKE